VSYSGYCGQDDRCSTGDIDLGSTIEHELQNEIGALSADSRKMVLTGLHVNAKSGAVDVLCVWQLEANTAELVDQLSGKYPNLRKVFETTKKAVEPFVWDSENLIVDFSGPAIARALRRVSSSERDPVALIPEAFVCLWRSLEASGYPTTQLHRILAQ
jgi:hypothetical protein